MSCEKKRIISRNPSARIAGGVFQHETQTVRARRLTFVDGVRAIVAVMRALVAVTEDMIREIPVVLRVWCKL